MKKQVYFVGAGTGDPELLTLKAKRLIDSADTIIYAGSLVNKEIFQDRKDDAKLVDSSKLSLEQIFEIIKSDYLKNKNIVRVQSGDPTIYGAIKEQCDLLDSARIPYEVIPGVSSFTASAARLKKELTVPEITQTIILTRMSGRTIVPDLEKLEELAKHKSSLAIFLSVQLIDQVEEALLRVLSPNTKVALIYHVSWPDEKIVETKLKNLAQSAKENQLTKTTMILVGSFLEDNKKSSKLYDKTFEHEYRDKTDS